MASGYDEQDPIVQIMDMWDFSPFQDEDSRRERVYKEIQQAIDNAKSELLDRVIAESEEVTERMDSPIYVGDTRVDYRTRKMISLSKVQAERAKLKSHKEGSDEQ